MGIMFHVILEGIINFRVLNLGILNFVMKCKKKMNELLISKTKIADES